MNTKMTGANSPSNNQIDLTEVEDHSTEVAEVITSFGRSVLDVAHVGQTRSRAPSSLPLLGLGGLLMAGGLGLFGYEVAQPWDEYNLAVAQAQQHHAEAPQAPGLGTGSLGMGLALLGLVPFMAGLMRRRDLSIESYTIGEGSEANFKVSGALLPDPAAMALVSRTESGYAIAFTPDMSGSVELGEHALSLRDLVESGRAQAEGGRYTYALPSGARAKLEHGEVRFNVNLVKRGAIVAGRGEIDWPFWSYFGGTATVATAFYMLMRSMPDNAMAMEIDDEDAAARFASYFHEADEAELAEPVEPEPSLEPGADAGGESSSGAKGDQGKMGDKRSNNTSGKYKLKGSANSQPQIARHYDPIAAASEAGILGILAAQDHSFVAAVDGGAFNVGSDDADLWGNITGVEYAAANGVAGIGLTNIGRYGGQAGNMIGLDDAGLLGNGPGSDGIYRAPSSGLTGFGEHRKKVPAPRVGKGEVKGQVDKEVIRRVVRGHINEVRSCYNKGLTSNPNLQGRVSIQFSLIGSGKVASSVVVDNTTKSKSVADCIARAIKRWKFPPVRGGGTALVTYPFLLNAR